MHSDRFHDVDAKFKHSVPALIILVDIMVNGLPIRVFHALYVALFGLAYAIFTYIYSLSDKTPIYPMLNWSKPLLAAGMSSAIIAITIILQVGIHSFPNTNFDFSWFLVLLYNQYHIWIEYSRLVRENDIY